MLTGFQKYLAHKLRNKTGIGIFICLIMFKTV